MRQAPDPRGAAETGGPARKACVSIWEMCSLCATGRVAQWCNKGRHRPIPEQHRHLVQKLRGHYGYYGITGTGRSLSCF